MSTGKELRAIFTTAPLLTVGLAAASFFGIFRAITTLSGTWESPLALMILVLFMSFHVLKKNMSVPVGTTGNKPLSGLVLLAAWCLMFYGKRNESELCESAALGIMLLSILIFRYGAIMIIRTTPILLVAFVMLPFQESWLLMASYPLRLISTDLSVGLFSIIGVSIKSIQTTIFIGDAQIAITDACSGVSQLWVLLFFACILSWQLRCKYYKKLLWAGLILPIVIISNTIRLILTIMLYIWIGERAFELDIHIILGYFFILLTLTLLWLSSRLLSVGVKEK